MARWKKSLFIIMLCFICTVLCVGYAAVSGTLEVRGNISVTPPPYDVYITNVTPSSSSGVTDIITTGTMFSAKVVGSGTANFEISFINVSDKTYVYERVVDGSETDIEDVYDGSDIKYTVSGISALDEIAPDNGTLTLNLQVTVPADITADNYILLFKFIEKQGWEILPDGEDPVPDPDPDPDPEPDPDPDDVLYGDFRGLVQALLEPTSDNSLNSSNDLIYSAVMEGLTSDKRPEEDAPILHCHVNSISGGTMSSIAESANEKLTENLHFIFEADPNNEDRLLLYMYYGDDCQTSAIGKEILVYKQIVTRGTDGVWSENGTYIGHATVGYFYGGGKNGKDVLTINAYSWKAGEVNS